MHYASVLVLKSIKLIGGKLMEQAGMQRIIACALWLLTSWQSEGAVTKSILVTANARCSLSLLENFSEPTEEREVLPKT